MRSIRFALFGLACLLLGTLVGRLLPNATAEDAAASTPTLYELRTYYTVPGQLDRLNARFRDHTMRLFAKHGMKNVIYLTPEGETDKLVYLLGHKDRATRDASFEAFIKDPEWVSARDASEQPGKIVDKIESVFFVPTDYSPLQ